MYTGSLAFKEGCGDNFYQWETECIIYVYKAQAPHCSLQGYVFHWLYFQVKAKQCWWRLDIRELQVHFGTDILKHFDIKCDQIYSIFYLYLTFPLVPNW